MPETAGEDEVEEDPETAGSTHDVNEEEARFSFTELNKSHFDTVVNSAKTKKRSTKAVAIQIWLPLTFPEIPKKGDFDVRRLLKSEYFFS